MRIQRAGGTVKDGRLMGILEGMKGNGEEGKMQVLVNVWDCMSHQVRP